MPAIVKNDKRREPYNREKISKGIHKAAQKRPLTTADLSKLIDDIERSLSENHPGEVSSKIVGEVTMQKLYQLDPVAYVRFASVYKDFREARDFEELLGELSEEGTGKFSDEDNPSQDASD